jgi:hypothetical protein
LAQFNNIWHEMGTFALRALAGLNLNI